MGNRLSKIYTKTGDQGTTALSDAKRVSKSNNIFAAIGDIDELNSTIGLLISKVDNQENKERLISIQHILFNIGAELSFPEYGQTKPEHTLTLEKWLDEMNNHLEPLKEFILPGGTEASSITHICRSISRRAERSIVSVQISHSVSPNVLSFVNRLSDYFFVLARYLNKNAGNKDVYWKSHRIKS
jgi:cob(I)alamin adenosyltransferase